MRFCSACEKPLEFFEFLDGDLCATCTETTQTSAKNKTDQPFDPGELGEALFTVEHDKIILRSKEGQLLWSGTTHEPTTLKTILARARKIMEIRSNNKKKG